MKAPRFSFFLALLVSFSAPLFAIGEISIENVVMQEIPPFRYQVTGTIRNASNETREVVLRGQIVVYDRGVRKGDVPLRVLRRDVTIILKNLEERQITVDFVTEGRLPDVATRTEGFLRMRRQRVWNHLSTTK